jgi:hypothetical protein
MHTLTPDEFWAHFKQRYGENKHLVSTWQQCESAPVLRAMCEAVAAWYTCM